jgi:signal transduction histidine kinase
MPLKLEKVNVDLLVKEAVSNFRLSAQKKQINLSHNVPEQDIKLMLDRNRILQVVNNLVSNAVKYTPEGGSVSAGYEYLPAEQQVRICIRDSGLGIPPEALPHLFEPFYRIDGRHHNLADGSGLGLAIARAIVEQHHGGIQVESEADNGTTFTITLPAL